MTHSRPDPVVLASLIRQLVEKWEKKAAEGETAATIGYGACARDLSALLAAPVQVPELPQGYAYLPKTLRRCAEALEQFEDGPADPAVVMHEAANTIEALLAAVPPRQEEKEDEPCVLRAGQKWCLTHHCYPSTCAEIKAALPPHQDADRRT